MKKSLLILCICSPLISLAQVNWEISNTGIDPSFVCMDMAAANGKVFSCGTKSIWNNDEVPALFTSDDQGTSWQEVIMNGIPDVPGMVDISYTGKRLIASFGRYRKYGPMLSDDNGKTWRLPVSGIDTINEMVYNTSASGHARIIALGAFLPTGSYILYNSIDTGNTWSKKTILSPYGHIYDLKIIGDKLFAYCDDAGNRIFVSHDLGETWNLIGHNFAFLSFTPDMISGDGRNLHLMGEQGAEMGIYTSNDSGLTWQVHPYSIKDNLTVTGYMKGAHDNGVYYAALYHKFSYKMFVSRDKLSVAAEPGYKSLAVFPNPATNQLNLNIPHEHENWTAEIFSLQGQLVQSAEAWKQTIDISGIATGVYLLKVVDGEQYYHTKFVKE